jgi:hypothetical protein
MEEATMDKKEKTLGVTEARFGLTILICGLVAIGYIVLLRLGSTSEALVEHRQEIEPRIASKPTPDEDQPTVLPIKPESSNPQARLQQPERSLLPSPDDGKSPAEVQRR